MDDYSKPGRGASLGTVLADFTDVIVLKVPHPNRVFAIRAGICATGIGTYSHVLIYRVVHVLIPVVTLELIEGFADDALVFLENQFLSGSRGT